MRPVAEQFWGTYISTLELDLIRGELRMDLHYQADGRPRSGRLIFVGISEIAYRNAIPLPWERAELTEIHEQPDEYEKVFTLVIWSEECLMTIKAFEMLTQ